MQYKEKLLGYIYDNNTDSLFEWILAQPVLEQVDILRQFKQIVQEMLANINDDSQNELLLQLDKKIDEYQETYLDEQVLALKHQILVDDRDKMMEDMWDRIAGIRLYLKECIETNAPNATQMKEMAKGMIELEKNGGYYDPLNWAWYKED